VASISCQLEVLPDFPHHLPNHSTMSALDRSLGGDADLILIGLSPGARAQLERVLIVS
jgi:hypothetical protein